LFSEIEPIVDKKSIGRFKKTLAARRQELHQLLFAKHQEGRMVEPDHGKDEGDRATTSQTRELLFLQTSRDRSLLSAIEAALSRIDAGTFGECLNCEQEITIKRLEAVPWVRYCITCQELIDSAE
jgi:DnaK suppressor protein